MTIPILAGFDVRDGRVVRTVRMVRASIEERFTVSFNLASAEAILRQHHPLAEVRDSRPFLEDPMFEGSLLYVRPLETDDADAALKWALGLRVREWTGNIDVINLLDVEPEAEGAFWNTIALLGGRADGVGLEALVQHLTSLSTCELTAFQARLEYSVVVLSDCLRPRERTTAALTEWLAIIARGRPAYERALLGDLDSIPTGEREAAEGLAHVVLKAWVRSTDRVLVIADRPRVWGQLWKRVDLAYRGPRDPSSLIAAGLFPQIVGSRFLGRTDRGLADVVAIQVADPDLEDRAQLVHRIQLAAQRNEIQAIIEPQFYATRTGSIFPGLPVFESLGRAELR